MTKLWCMRGLSGSGKSHRAAEIARESGAVIVCRDDLRKMLLGSHWTGRKVDEDRVTIAEEAQVAALIKSGVSTVVDATHLHTPYLRRWARLATRLGAKFEVVDVHSDIEECKRNDHARMLGGGRYVGDGVIEKQAKRWPVERWPVVTAEPPLEIIPYVPDISLPEALILDLDGTIALHTSGRSPYDYTRVHEDTVNGHVRDVVNSWVDVHPYRRVLAVSGREDSCREATAKWLRDNRVAHDLLLMRKAGDFRRDAIVKYEIFNSEIRDRYNVRFAIDDRLQVIQMYRKLGLTVFDVAGNEF